MTREEALEHLNLTEHSSTQLIRKRYLELHDDYEKAIAEAPSDHFRQLYRANLDKIEEAYLLMRENPLKTPQYEEGSSRLSPDIIERIQEVKKTVQSFVKFKQENPRATPEQQEELKAEVAGCISVISGLQKELASEGSARAELNAVVDDLISINQTSDDDSIEEPHDQDVSDSNQFQEPRKEPLTHESVPASPNEFVTNDSFELPETEENPELGLNKKNSKILLGLLSSILILGLVGLTYLYYPLLLGTTPETQPEKAMGQEQSLDRFSVLKIVGDEFYRVDNYVEALIQYTMALSIKAEDQYLLQMVDSCRLHLSIEQKQIVKDRLNESDSSSTSPPPVIDPKPIANRPTKDKGNNYGITSPELENGFVDNSLGPANRETANNQHQSKTDLSPPDKDPPGNLEANNSKTEISPEPKRSGGKDKESEFKEEKVYHLMDINPVPIEGYDRFIRYLGRNIKYPRKAANRGTSGVVIVQMVVLKDGTITNLQVAKKLGNGCDEEALRVIQAYPGKWKPGIRDGIEVNGRVAIPITFKLN